MLKRRFKSNHPEMNNKKSEISEKKRKIPTGRRPPYSRVDAHSKFELKCLHQDRNKAIILSSFSLPEEFDTQGRSLQLEASKFTMIY